MEWGILRLIGWARNLKRIYFLLWKNIILGDPGAASQVEGIFMDKRRWLGEIPSTRIAAPGSPSMAEYKCMGFLSRFVSIEEVKRT